MPRAKVSKAVVITLLTVLILVVAGGVAFGVWVYARSEERRADEIRIRQLDDKQVEMDGFVRQYTRLEPQFESEDERRKTRESRQDTLRYINGLITEQNTLVRKWPELHRNERPLRTIK